MKRIATFCLLAIILIFASCKNKGTGTIFTESKDLDKGSYKFEGCIEPDTFIKLAQKVSPAVVNINTSKTIKMRNFGPFGFFGDDNDKSGNENFFEKFFGMPKNNQKKDDKVLKQNSLGSGFIINKEGYIVTNNHVVEQVDEINVTLTDDESQKYKVKVIGKDPKTDVALIKIDAKKDLSFVILGDSDALKVGEVVVAIGNPFGFSHTVTQGIVSAKERTIGLGNYDSFIQTDASINPGNSGGPLLNIDGEVVGINTAIVQSGQGIGFSIPINIAKGVVSQLKEKGKVTRAWLGVYIQKITDDLANSLLLKNRDGALVSSVMQGGPADKAGIKSGDVIVSFEGKAIKDYNELPIAVSTKPIGKTCEIVIMRDGKEKKLSIVLEELKDKEPEEVKQVESTKNKLGIVVENINGQGASEVGIDKEVGGVMVSSIKGDSPAQEKGLMVGDVILEINKKKIKNVSDYDKVLSGLKKGDNILLYVKRAKDLNLFIAFNL